MSGRMMNSDYFNSLVDKIRKDDGWFGEFIKLVKVYYESNITGASLHIVLDDGNLNNSHIDWCAGYAAGKQDEMGSDIANLLKWMTKKQRRSVYKNYKLYAY